MNVTLLGHKINLRDLNLWGRHWIVGGSSVSLLCLLVPGSHESLAVGGENGTMAERAKALALLLQFGLMQVRILEAAMRGKNVWNIGKPPAPNSVPYVPKHIDGRPAM